MFQKNSLTSLLHEEKQLVEELLSLRVVVDLVQLKENEREFVSQSVSNGFAFFFQSSAWVCRDHFDIS